VWLDRGPEYNWNVMEYDPNKQSQSLMTRKTQYRYNSSLSNRYMIAYGVVQTIVVLLQVSWLLQQHDFDWPATLLWAAHSLYSIFTVSMLFDQRWFASYVDVVRLLLLPSLISWHLNRTNVVVGGTKLFSLTNVDITPINLLQSFALLSSIYVLAFYRVDRAAVKQKKQN
jgi:hypothetical protein